MRASGSASAWQARPTWTPGVAQEAGRGAGEEGEGEGIRPSSPGSPGRSQPAARVPGVEGRGERAVT